MPPDRSPLRALRRALESALFSLGPSAHLVEISARKLAQYAHELAFPGEAPPLAAPNDGPELPVHGWVALTLDQNGDPVARRHYVVAEADLAESSAWFPSLLGIAARLRTYLTPDEQAEVTILVVARPGSSTTRLAGRAAVLERNEAFAQVLVWMPGIGPESWPDSAARFVGRLRLGPIDGPAGSPGRDLSPMDAVFRGTSLSAGVRAEWQLVLMNTSLRDVDRARLLLAAVERGEGEGHGG